MDFKQLILDFISELGEYDFHIPIDKQIKFFNLIGTFDIFNEEETREVMRSLFCENKNQCETFDVFFSSYFAPLKNESRKEREEKEKEATKEAIDESIASRIAMYEKLKNSVVKNKTVKIPKDTKIALLKVKTKTTNLEKILQRDKQTIFDMFEQGEEYIEKVEDDLENLLLYMLEHKLNIEFIMSASDYLSKATKRFIQISEDEEKDMETLQRALKQINKYESKNHRDVYTEGKNAVQSEKGFLYKDLNKLSDKDLNTLYRYIFQNANRLKTRISKNLKSGNRRIFDYKKVIKNSVKTDMVPIELFFKTPSRKKVKIVCITDISGSCKHASQILLSFVYALQEVFPGGVESFVFVKDLNEATDVFKNYSIEEANERTSVLVERNYSSYYDAFMQFDEKYFSRITKDTIVIYLGDARNNNNKTGTEFLERIRKKITSGCGRMYWLNPDEKSKWNQGDSIIGIYNKYMDKTFCIKTTKDLLNFLESISIRTNK